MPEVARLDIIIRTEKAVNAVKKVDQALDNTARKTDKSVKKMGGAFDRLKGKILSAQGAIAGLGVAFAFRGVFNVIKDFETAMSAVKAVTGATGEEFAALNKEARRLGATTTFSAGEAAQGMRFLAQAGFTTSEVLISTEAALQLAQAGMLGLGESADIVSNIMSAFQIEAEGTAAVGDVLAAVASKANTDIRQLGEAFKPVGGIARATGQDLRDVAAALGTLGDAGIQAGQAGTNIRNMLLTLLDAKKARLAADLLGVSIEKLNPTTRSVVEIINTFADAGLNAAQAQQIFQKRLANAVITLSDNRDRVNELAGVTRNADGALSKMSKTMTDNLRGSLKGFTSALQEAILQTGDAGLTGALRGILDTMAGVIRALTGMLDPLSENARLYQLLASVIKIAAGAFAGFALAKIVGGLIAMGGALVKLIKFIRTATAAQILLNLAMLANPIILIATLIGGLIVLLIEFGDTAVTVGDKTFTIWDLIAVALGSVIRLFGFLGKIAVTAGKLLIDAFTDVKDQAESVVRTVDRVFKSILNTAIAVSLSIVDAYIAMGKLIFRTFSGLVAGMITLFEGLGSAIVSALKGDFKGAGRELSDAFSGEIDIGLEKTLDELKESVAKNFDTDFAGSAQKAVQGAINIVGAGVVNATGKIVDDAAKRYEARAQAAADNAEDALKKSAKTADELLAPKPGAGIDIVASAGAGKKKKDPFGDLRESLDSVFAAQKEFAEGEKLIAAALKKGKIEKQEATKLTTLLENKYRDLRDPLMAVQRELEQETKLLGLSADARELEAKFLEIQNALLDSGKILREGEAAALKDQLRSLQKLTKERQTEEQLLERITGETKRLTEEQNALNKLFKTGQISLEQYNRQIRESTIRQLEAQKDATSGFRRGFLKLQEELADMASVTEALVLDTFADMKAATVDFVETGIFEFDKFIAALQRRLLEAALDDLFGQIFGAGGILDIGKIFGEPGKKVPGETIKMKMIEAAPIAGDIIAAKMIAAAQGIVPADGGMLSGGGGRVPFDFANDIGEAIETAGGTAGRTVADSMEIAGQTVGSGWQSVFSGIGNFLGGIFDDLIGGLGDIFSSIGSLFSSGGAGGAGGGSGFLTLLTAFLEKGGISQHPSQTRMVPAAAFAHARSYQGGGLSNGGIPAILHKNEAVVPLSGGRKIPVELGEGRDLRPINLTMNVTTPDADSFRRSKSKIGNDLHNMVFRAGLRK